MMMKKRDDVNVGKGMRVNVGKGMRADAVASGVYDWDT